MPQSPIRSACGVVMTQPEWKCTTTMRKCVLLSKTGSHNGGFPVAATIHVSAVVHSGGILQEVFSRTWLALLLPPSLQEVVVLGVPRPKKYLHAPAERSPLPRLSASSPAISALPCVVPREQASEPCARAAPSIRRNFPGSIAYPWKGQRLRNVRALDITGSSQVSRKLNRTSCS